ncbi:MAG: DNA repair protein RecN [Dysgonamonadaceae bacterium]|jgi:DNA repair protein RecN (Recombination protein N)|nr:DNA repair protein RecN [Dysgonamonadaceae bacterium]
MLQTLAISNYALISGLEINFPTGFSVITGETGAGKSIILGALSLILGQRADAKSIKQDAEKCSVEGVFDISSYQLETFFKDRGLEYDPRTCILRREIWTSGKSRGFINDSPAGLNDLKELGAYLIDIHSQHQNLLLADNQFQLQVLDVLAQNKNLQNEYQAAYKKYLSAERQLNALKERIGRQQAEEEYIRFQYKQLDEARLQTGEQTALEEERETLSHVEEIKSGLYRVGQLLSADEKGVVATLKEALKVAQSLQEIYPASGEISERLNAAYLDMKDLAPETDAQQESLEFKPERLQEVNERLDLIYSLQHKHHLDSVEELIELHSRWETQIREIDHAGEELENMEKNLSQAHAQVLLQAAALSESRTKAAEQLEKELVEKIAFLGMPYIRFAVEMTPKTPDATGADEVAYLFSANKNSELKPVAQTASGGEISRLMLGVKSLIAGTMALPSIIFDEIDTGVSGEIADKMGDIMRRMGSLMQVIAITHLPQIAAKGDTQFLVYKDENTDSAETQIQRLSGEERVHEIARMLSGATLTDAAIENAKVLLRVNK